MDTNFETAKKLQEKIEMELIYDVEDKKLYNLSYKFRTKLLIEKGWVFTGVTDDIRYNEIYQNGKYKSMYCINTTKRCFCFTTDINNTTSWFCSEVIFEAIINNLKQ